MRSLLKRLVVTMAMFMILSLAIIPTNSVSAHSACATDGSQNHTGYHWTGLIYHQDRHEYSTHYWSYEYHWWYWGQHWHKYVTYKSVQNGGVLYLHSPFDMDAAKC